MSLGSSSSALFLNAQGAQKTPLSVRLQTGALFSILDHYLRRKDSQKRVIGTLTGVRTDNEVEVRTAFAVLHSETADQVAIDEEYFRNMLEISQRVHPKEQVVGWYSTGRELNTFSALIQNYYSQETNPHQAIHLTVDTGEESEELGVKAYIGSPVGVQAKPDNCMFVPIPVHLRNLEADRPGLHLLSTAASSETHTTSTLTDLQNLEASLHEVLSMIDRVQAYIQSVLTGETEGDVSVGRYLLETLSTATDGLESGRLESLFNSHLQDTLMISYLANLVRSQAEVSTRLTLVT